jgi:hypothetical protein
MNGWYMRDGFCMTWNTARRPCKKPCKMEGNFCKSLMWISNNQGIMILAGVFDVLEK